MTRRAASFAVHEALRSMASTSASAFRTRAPILSTSARALAGREAYSGIRSTRR